MPYKQMTKEVLCYFNALINNLLDLLLWYFINLATAFLFKTTTIKQKTMNRKWLVMLASVTITSIAVAQTTPPPPPPAPMSKEEKEKIRLKQEEELAAAYKEAGITDEQVAKIKAEELDARTKVKAIDDEVKGKLETLLTKEVLKKVRDTQKKQRDDYAKLPPPATPLSKEEKQALKLKQEEELATSLKAIGLTDAQLAELKTVDEAAYKQKSAINNERNKKIIEIAGQENWKKFKDIQNRQKEAAKAAKPM